MVKSGCDNSLAYSRLFGSSALARKICHLSERNSVAFRRISDFVMTDPVRVTSFTISDLASSAGVSIATVTRFCTSLELQGYPHFKRELANTIAETLKENGHPNLGQLSVVRSDWYNKFREGTAFHNVPVSRLGTAAWQTVITALSTASRVLIVGLGESAYIAELLESRFADQLNISAAGFAGTGAIRQRIRHLRHNDALVILSTHSDTDSELEELLIEAVDKGIRPILPFCAPTGKHQRQVRTHILEPTEEDAISPDLLWYMGSLFDLLLKDVVTKRQAIPTTRRR
ncbi:SIS domain-containing protein [Paraburkholderia strydomiana]|uniref:SIS domain-containing protein n=1 Tax=Paraburkholderia strydomiana TaxID=1245417 RepID=A0ABW9EG54_9BURK